MTLTMPAPPLLPVGPAGCAGPDADSGRPAADLHARLMEGVRSLVIEGVLPDGAKVPEAALCARFGVSRTPMREALKALAAEGFLDLSPNRGARVAPLDPDTLAAVFEAKGALERLIGHKAAERADREDLDELDALHADLGGALSRADAPAYTRLNERFHCRLARTVRNPVIEQLYAGMTAKVLRARRLVNVDEARMAASYAEHEAIMTALRARAPLDLGERLVRHNEATASALLALFDPDR